MSFLTNILFSLFSIFSLSTSTTFLSVGDWGAASIGGYHYKNAYNTANSMLDFINYVDTDFVLILIFKAVLITISFLFSLFCFANLF